MFEIIFKCLSCGEHLSASPDDCGYAFACPACDAELVVPPGDILFPCPKCAINLLACANTVGDDFGCPRCEQRIRVPSEGKEISLPKRFPEKSGPPPSSSDVKPMTAKQTPQTASSDGSSTPADRQFMVAWGDYLATAGLTEDIKLKVKGKGKSRKP